SSTRAMGWDGLPAASSTGAAPSPSGRLSDPRTCPCWISKKLNAKRTETGATSLLPRLGCGLRRRRRTRRRSIAEREVQDRDLLLLLDDDPLGESPQTLVLAIAQLGGRHVDGSLVVGDHHPGEVLVGIAGEGHVH